MMHEGAYGKLDKGQIRLLELRSGDSDTPIVCHLTVYPLAAAPAYSALSYKWGSASISDAEILLNGHPFQVRKNLFRFLGSARGLEKPLGLLWIDALCIHQANIIERGEQVSQMPEVFKRAAQVVVWLGPAYGGSDAAMNALNSRCLWKANATASIAATSQRSTEIALLCHRPYWRRLWVLQELVLANKTVLMCGSKTAPCASFSKLLLQINESWRSAESRLKDHFQYTVMDTSPAKDMAMLMQQSFGDVHLSDLLVSTSHLMCSNQLDRVYALLGIGFFRHQVFRPDYTIQVADLLSDIMRQAHATAPPDDLDTVERQYSTLARIFDVEQFAISKTADQTRMPWLLDWLQISRPTALKELAQMTYVSDTYPERCWPLPGSLFDSSRSRHVRILWWAIFYKHQAVHALFVTKQWKSYICEMYLGFHLQDIGFMRWFAEEAILPMCLREYNGFSSDPDVFQQDQALLSLMELVCYRGDVAALRRLIAQHGAFAHQMLTQRPRNRNIDTIGDRIHCLGHLGCLKLVMEQGAKHSGKQVDAHCFTAQYFKQAVRYGFLDLVRALLPAVSSLERGESQVGAALLGAAARGQEEVVTLILDNPFDSKSLVLVSNDAYEPNLSGWRRLCLRNAREKGFSYRQLLCAFEEAVEFGKHACAEVILKADGIIWSANNRFTHAFIDCAGRGDIRMTELLLKHGAAEVIDSLSCDSESAVRHQKDEMVKLLKAYVAKDCLKMAAVDLPKESPCCTRRLTCQDKTTLGITHKDVSAVSAVDSEVTTSVYSATKSNHPALFAEV